MRKKKAKQQLTTIIDETHKIPDKQGNGVIRLCVKVDEKGKVKRYSMAYINSRISTIDNGRVLGYDNSHGYHHRHHYGKEEGIDYKSFDLVYERFEKEWRELHAKAKNR